MTKPKYTKKNPVNFENDCWILFEELCFRDLQIIPGSSKTIWLIQYDEYHTSFEEKKYWEFNYNVQKFVDNVEVDEFFVKDSVMQNAINNYYKS